MKKERIKQFVLQNALKYGRANPKAVLGKLLSEDTSLKGKVKEVIKEIEVCIKEVGSRSWESMRKELEKSAPALLQKKEAKKKELPDLPRVDRPYIFRIEPSPTGPLHIGHTIVLLLNTGYAKKYGGKMLLRIGDTNPAEIYPPAYDMIVEDAQWITKNSVDEVVVQSDRMDDYYAHAKMLIGMGKAFVCDCDTEQFRVLIQKKKACPCRSLSVEEQEERWQKMFRGYDEGEAVLRIKTDVKHPNPAVRDWPAFRISDTEHPRQGKKYRVWPLMNFSVAVDDHEYGLTHVIRGKDHIVNMERQRYVYTFFDWWIPEFIHIGRVNFKDLKISTSEFRRAIEKKQYDGWDDPRLPTLRAFHKRGLKPEAFMRYVKELGPSRVDKTVSYKEFMQSIYAFNRELIEHEANRYFLVEKPMRVKIKSAPSMTVKIPLHPDAPSRGARRVKTGNEFYVEDTLEAGKAYRFMHLFNLMNKSFVSTELDKSLKAQLIHWLPVSDELVVVKVHMVDGTVVKGFGEPDLKKVKEGQVVQFERKFFARLDKKEKGHYSFYFTHA